MRVALVLVALLAAGCLEALPGSPDPSPAVGLVADCSISFEPGIWPDACTALASRNPSPSKSEIDLAVNPTDPLNVIVGSKDLDPLASDCVWSVLQVTKDGGRTWKTVYVGGTKESRPEILSQFKCVTDPIMAFDADGVAYYALQAYRATEEESTPALPMLGAPVTGSSFVLATSHDGGETWGNYLVQHAGDGTLMFHDYPRMIVNPATQSVHTIWNGVGLVTNQIWISSTRDGGETVAPPVTFSAADSPGTAFFYSGFGATIEGTIFVTVQKTIQPSDVVGLVTGDRGDGNSTAWLYRSDDDALTFAEVGPIVSFLPTPAQLETNQFRSVSFAEMAVDASAGPHAGRIHVFWPDYSTGNSDIMTTHSDDGGASWSAPARAHRDAAGDQLMPRPRVGPDGTVYLLYYDRAFDPANKLLDASLAWSVDGGESWESKRLTASSFDGDLGVHQSGFPFIGDYNGLDVARDGTVYAAWGDTRTGVAEIAFARLARE